MIGSGVIAHSETSRRFPVEPTFSSSEQMRSKSCLDAVGRRTLQPEQVDMHRAVVTCELSSAAGHPPPQGSRRVLPRGK